MTALKSSTKVDYPSPKTQQMVAIVAELSDSYIPSKTTVEKRGRIKTCEHSCRSAILGLYPNIQYGFGFQSSILVVYISYCHKVQSYSF